MTWHQRTAAAVVVDTLVVDAAGNGDGQVALGSDGRMSEIG